MFFSRSKNLVGLDIGSSSIKVVELNDLGKGKGYQVINAGVPGSTASRASSSASTMLAPRARSIRATVDLPVAIPPVRPINRIEAARYYAGRTGTATGP